MIHQVRQINLAFLGFGHVGRAFARLLIAKRRWLLRELGIEWRLTGVATASHGMCIDPAGLPLPRLLRSRKRDAKLTHLNRGPECPSASDFIRQCGADVLFEMTVLTPDGEPAAAHIRDALKAGLHVVTVNKGPVAADFRHLTRLARQRSVRFLYEGTVMDGAPVFNLFRQALPATHIRSLRGILNSTTNHILTQMEQGTPFDEALRYAQDLGIAEADSRLDVEGWDAAAKLSILIHALMHASVKPEQIHIQGISGDTGKLVRAAVRRDRRIRLVARAFRQGGRIVGKVAPEELEVFDPLAGVRGLSNILILHTDTMGELSLVENNPSVEQTAFALFSDLVTLLRRPQS